MPVCPACYSEKETFIERIEFESLHRSLFSGKKVVLDQLMECLNAVNYPAYADFVKCQHCRLEYTFPLIAPPKEWYSVFYSNLSLYPQDRWEFERVLSEVAFSKCVGEIGCGSGNFLEKARQKGILARGFDSSEDAVKSCNKMNLPAFTREINSQQPFGEENAYVVAFHVLEHLDNPQRLFQVASEWSNPQGELFVSVPSDRSPYRLRRNFLDLPPHHLTKWSRKALVEIGHKTGWQMTDLFYEPTSTRVNIWWLTITHPWYTLSNMCIKSGMMEKMVRAILFPFVFGQDRAKIKFLSGESMLAKFQKKRHL